MKGINKAITWAAILATTASTCACMKLPKLKITDMTMFAAMPGLEKEEKNDIKELIAKKTGVRVNETWLAANMDWNEAVHYLMESDELPDFIDGSDASIVLYDNDLLVAWDEYLEKYPNLKELYTDEEWDRFRMDDGHIYWANVFDNYYKKDTTTVHSGTAFWIQARVLEWANYPEVETLDDYFKLLDEYAKANPTLPDGTKVIPYTCLCDDWKYYCLESAPKFLDGYPDNGDCIVNVDNGPENPKIVDYNTTATAKAYFKKLNEEFKKGNVDPDCAKQTYDEYIAKLSTGAVLGLCDQYWDFAYNIMEPFASELTATDGKSFTLSGIGCDYVPLGLTIEKGMKQQWHTYGDTLNTASGIGVTTSCSDPDLAFYFMNALLDQDIHDLRFWGINGVDYLIDSDGVYYRTEEMRDNWNSDSYMAQHTCEYTYFPQWNGMSKDGRNRMKPEEQPGEYLASLPKPLSDCFKAYGVSNYVEMIGSAQVEQYPWYPMWTWSNSLSTETAGGVARLKMKEVKHKYLPMLVLSSDFEKDWKEYMKAYDKADPKAFLDEAQAEVDARLQYAVSKGWTPG